MLDLQRAAGNRAVSTLLAGAAPGAAPVRVQRREVAGEREVRGVQDWTTADRIGNTERWKAACLHNLNRVDSSQYLRIVERRDFYRWFYEHTAALGYTTRWALAAALVASGAHEIADMDEAHELANDALGLANVELQGTMREGNQVIFDNVLPKLKRLLDGGPLTGAAALRWDMQILAEEQTLVQPLYARMSPQTVAQINYIARKVRFAGMGASMSGGDRVAPGPYNQGGTVPAFGEPDITRPTDRWTYGMRLGNQFAPGGTGFRPGVDAMPAPGAGYADGTELARVDTRAHLHQLDAWLNPNRLSRVRGEAGSDLQAIIDGLTEPEKAVVVADRSADGWAYSTQFAQFSFISESTVRGALPSGPAHAAAVAAFLARYQAERDRVRARYPDGVMMVQ